MSAKAANGSSAKLAVIGDVHGMWGAEDEVALNCLGADMAMFVGDFGEEDVELVRKIAGVKMPKAVILGNHDGWYSLKSHRQRSQRPTPIPDPDPVPENEGSLTEAPPCNIALQMNALGPSHVGYSSLEVPLAAAAREGTEEDACSSLRNGEDGNGAHVSGASDGNRSSFSGRSGFTVVGGRPFSSGGKSLMLTSTFYKKWYGVEDTEQSRRLVVDVASKVAHRSSLIVMAHNGPTGLGARRHNICGVDWTSKEGDHGDLDLELALSDIHSMGAHVPLVLFGHMHHVLKGGKLREMAAVDSKHRTVYLNAATVPRVRQSKKDNGGTPGLMQHHFLLVSLQDGEVESASNVWCEVVPPEDASPTAAPVVGEDGAAGLEASGWRAHIVQEIPVFKTEREASSNSITKMYFNAFSQTWKKVQWSPWESKPEGANKKEKEAAEVAA